MNPPELPAWLRELYPFEPKRFETGAGAMSYLDEGQGEEAVLMVHGNPTWSFFYRQVVIAVHGRIRCIVPDHLGCGLSDKPQSFEYTLANHVENLRRLVDSLNLKKIHLIVHDWGGPIGLGTCLPQPEKLGRAVILNTAAFADTVIPKRIRFCRVPGIGELVVRGFNGFAGPATWMAVTQPLPDAVKRGFLFPYDSWANRIATHRFVVDIPRGVGAPNDQALAKIEAALPLLRERPTLILWGGADFCFNRHYYERWRRLLPEARAEYLDTAGHYLLEDAPAECVAAIQRHLGF
ncbi:MAG TPA: alpha/beta fold hydrolase [Lacunisphaera sp.]|nr:alpha/beta fold hydrolase [Lacunisphaera sp.]